MTISDNVSRAPCIIPHLEVGRVQGSTLATPTFELEFKHPRTARIGLPLSSVPPIMD